MVIEDISHYKNDNSKITHRAPYIDRIFANVIDLLILTPVLGLFTAEITSEIRWTAFLQESDDVSFLLGQYLFLVFVLFLLYESLFNYFIKATPGHYFLYMRITHEDGKSSVPFLNLIFRSVFKFLSLLGLFIPLLEILVRPDRRSYFDRIAMTQIYSFKQETNDEIPFEMRLWILNWSKSVIVLLTFIFSFYLYNASREKSSEVNTVMKTIYKCHGQLQSYLLQYLTEEEKDSSRNCIWELSERSFKSKKVNQDNNINYFARHIIAEDKNLKDEYLKHYCSREVDSLPCQKNPKFSENRLELMDVVNYLYFLKKFEKEGNYEFTFFILDKIYNYTPWSVYLQNLYMTSYLKIENSKSRNPASSEIESETFSERKKRFFKRLGV